MLDGFHITTGSNSRMFTPIDFKTHAKRAQSEVFIGPASGILTFCNRSFFYKKKELFQKQKAC